MRERARARVFFLTRALFLENDKYESLLFYPSFLSFSRLQKKILTSSKHHTHTYHHSFITSLQRTKWFRVQIKDRVYSRPGLANCSHLGKDVKGWHVHREVQLF